MLMFVHGVWRLKFTRACVYVYVCLSVCVCLYSCHACIYFDFKNVHDTSFGQASHVTHDGTIDQWIARTDAISNRDRQELGNMS